MFRYAPALANSDSNRCRKSSRRTSGESTSAQIISSGCEISVSSVHMPVYVRKEERRAILVMKAPWVLMKSSLIVTGTRMNFLPLTC